jgi:hypothetical protein
MKRLYYYVVAQAKDGRAVVMCESEWKSESDANAFGFKYLKGQLFNVVTKPYFDISRVTQESKINNLKDTGDLDSSIQRAIHAPSRLKFEEDKEENATI